MQLPSQVFVPEVPSPYCHHTAQGIYPCPLTWQNGLVTQEAITYPVISVDCIAFHSTTLKKIKLVSTEVSKSMNKNHHFSNLSKVTLLI